MGLLQAQVPVDSCVISRLPQPGLTRSVIVVNRPKELGAIPLEAANAAITVVREQCQQQLRGFPSWVLASMSFGTPVPTPKSVASREA